MKAKLVSYRDLPYGVRLEGSYDVTPISEENFRSLQTYLDHEHFDNCYMPRMYLQITGRCNLRCRHCFAAVDNNPLVTEWSLEDAKELFRQAREAGICSITMTGGEPTVYPHLIEILHCMKDFDLSLLSFNTNGYNLKDEVLDTFRELGFRPNIKISIDGIGHHDEFRGVKGSEARALEALQRCAKRGFATYTQTQVNRQTLDTLPALLDLVDDWGLASVRLIKTTQTPRWQQNGGEDDFTFLEYYEQMYRVIRYHIQKKHKTCLDIWHLGEFYPDNHGVNQLELVRDAGCSGDQPLCPVFKRMISVGSDGKVYPCLEMQGIVNSLGYEYGSLKDHTLREILNEGPHRRIRQYTEEERKKHNSECVECRYRELCRGGCPGLGILYNHGDFLGRDLSCCEFFKTGMYDKFKEFL